MAEKLTDMTITGFAEVLASDAPAPGGGSAAALSGALGAALSSMVANLTIGKEKYAADEAEVLAAREKAAALKEDLLEAVDRDTRAFNTVSAAFGMPKETEEEKAARSRAIQEGLSVCIESPLLIMELTLEGLQLAKGLFGHFNESAASDLGVSALMLRAGLLGAWLNVKINLGSLKDREKAAAYEAKARTVLDEALPLAEGIYEEIEKSL